ncbi:MAG: cytochrome c biogenesis heme-transporting ATPase CcmA [Pseudomonadales bacterium]
MTPLLQTIDLCCERDGRILVNQLNLSVVAGNIYQVEGPNGSGKTTLLRALCGLSSRYSGEILWQGETIKKVRAEYFSQLLYIGHSAGVKAALTPRENLAWHVGIKGVENDAHQVIMLALKRTGLYGYEDMPCFTLSAGQQRRVGLARLFLGRPSLWILDEPFTAIDKQGVADLEGWIEHYVEQGGSVILTTHHELAISQTIHPIRLGDQ